MIVSIFVASESEGPLHSAAAVTVQAGAGIVGDRNFGRSDHPGQNVTFIAQESISHYNTQYGQSIEAIATRRNVVTRGVDLNALVGRDFTVGTAVFRGIELCTPCSTLGGLLANETITGAQVVKAFASSGGLRADVITDGRISTGMTVNIPEPG